MLGVGWPGDDEAALLEVCSSVGVHIAADLALGGRLGVRNSSFRRSVLDIIKADFATIK